jgi:PAS domain S-box-containing protein
MNWLMPALITTFISSLVVFFIFHYLYRQERYQYLAVWSASWGLYCLRYAFEILGVLWGPPSFFLILNQLTSLWAGSLLLWGTYLFSSRKLPVLWWVVSIADSLWIITAITFRFDFMVTTIPTFSIMAIANILTGISILQFRETGGLAKSIAGWSFIFWGLHKADYPFIRPFLWLAPWGFLIASAFGFISSLSVILIFFQKTKNDLQVSEEQFRRLIETAPEAVLLFDSEKNKFILANAQAENLFGCSRDELLKAGPDHFYAPIQPDGRPVLESMEENISRVLAGEELLIERIIRNASGKVFFCELRLVRLPSSEQRLILNSYLDITERKQAEDALRRSEERYRNVLESIEEGYYEVDIDGNFTFCNDAVFKMIEYSPDELLGMNFRQCTNEENAEKLFSVFNEVYRTGFPIKDFEFQVIKKDGTVGFGEVSIAILGDDSGAVIGFRGIVRDISKRKKEENEKRKLEERLQRAEKMEALGTLAGGVAHDLNNVLGVMVGYSELLRLEVSDSSPLRVGLENILSGSQRAAAIVQDLLALARRGVMDRRVINLNKVIQECQNSPELKKLILYHSRVSILLELEPDLLNISGSSVHLNKALFNLISNASEAMPQGGTITVKTSNQYLDKPIQSYDEVQEGDYVVLSVTDSGEGIAAADLERIFEPFYTKKVMGRSGTGLGLAVVWGTIKDHHGYINVKSEPVKGSTFTLYFPVTREEISAERASRPMSEYMGKGESILVVDDVEGQRDLAREMLKRLNYNVASVESGEEAVVYLKGHPVDLLVLDMIMDPGMDGLDTYKKILEINPKQKAIIVSGFSESDRVRSAQALGAGTYVKKPYVLEKLGLAIRKELES